MSAEWRTREDVVTSRVTNSNAAFSKLEKLKELKVGWHFGKGLPPSDAAYKAARIGIIILQAIGVKAVEVFPGESGGLLVSGLYNNYTLDIGIDESGRISLVIDCHDNEIVVEEGLTWEQTLNHIRTTLSKVRTESGLSILFTTAMINRDSKALHSLPKTEKFRSSMRNVQSGPQGHYASTYQNTIVQRSPEVRRFSSGSPRSIYQSTKSSGTKKVPETFAISI